MPFLTFLTSVTVPARWAVANTWTDTPAAVHAAGLTHTCAGGGEEESSLAINKKDRP